MILSQKRKSAYESVARTPLSLVGRLRRVQSGLKDYQTGLSSETRDSYEIRAFEQQLSADPALVEARSGQRRFLIALSGQAFTADPSWIESLPRTEYVRPRISDRIWLEQEGRELLISATPAILDAGLGVLFEVVTQ